jgi:hypothetical protein
MCLLFRNFPWTKVSVFGKIRVDRTVNSILERVREVQSKVLEVSKVR